MIWRNYVEGVASFLGNNLRSSTSKCYVVSVTQLIAAGWISFVGSVLRDSLQIVMANKGTTAGVILGVAGIAAGMTVYHRYWSLRRIGLQLRPPVGEDAMRWGKKIYNWRMHD